MPQAKAWDREYKKRNLVTGSKEPQNDFKRFCKYLRKELDIPLSSLSVLDLGSGTGKNSLFLAERGAKTTGLEISPSAIETARTRTQEMNLTSTFIEKSFGEPFPFADRSFNLALDIMSSNSLTEPERKVYLEEVSRVLTTDGYFFVRLLALNGDKHAETLLKTHPGKEAGTYVLPDVQITERVLSKDEFITYYSPFFNIIKLEKTSGYARVSDRLYKRQYWVAYLQNKA